MSYLTRRLGVFFADLKTGKLNLLPGVASQVASALESVQFDSDGEAILETVSPELRATARSYYLVQAHMDADTQEVPHQPVTERRLVELTRTLFELQQDVFGWATGTTPLRFASTHDLFPAAVRQLGSRGIMKNEKWYHGLQDRMGNLATFYKQSGIEMFRGARALVGLKMVLGGKQSFGSSSLAAARSMLLYTDTLLVPDSVARWFEKEGAAEAFRFPRLLEDLYGLLQLKPLVDADLPQPAVIVFPSMEGALEERDPVTQDGQELMALDLFSHCLSIAFEDLQEVSEFVEKSESLFVDRIMRHRLFVGLGGDGNESFAEAVKMTRDFYRKFRSKKMLRYLESASDARIAFLTILERVGPQYHLAENATELDASPLMSLPVHWHYCELLRKTRSANLTHEGILKSDHSALFQALAAPQHRWLGNVPIPELVELRRRGENSSFRTHLNKLTDELGGASSDDLDGAVNKVGRALSSLLLEHDRDVQNLVDSYKTKYGPQAVAAWATLGASWMPWFPSMAPAAALGFATAYVGTKVAEILDRRRLNRTLAGVLAASARAGK